MRTINFGWFSSILALVAEFKLFIMFSTYILVGALWGVINQKWSFVTALYYAFTACATGGLQKPSRTDDALLFTAFFILFGIPLYAMTLGTVASYFGEYVVLSMMKDEMENREAKRTVNFMERLDVLEDGAIDFEEWLCLELLRNDKASIDFLRQCRHEFQMMDEDESGTLTIDELRVQMPIIDSIIAKGKASLQKKDDTGDIPVSKENENSQQTSNFLSARRR